MFERKRAIYSSKEDDPDLEDEINEFVIRLAEYVDTLQDAESAGDHLELRRLAEELADRAQALGYAPLSQVARNVCEGCKQGKDDEIQEALIELTEVAQRVRLGHRGAA